MTLDKHLPPPGTAGRPRPAVRRRRGTVLAGISLGYFMVLLDTTVLSVAEPDLAASLHTSVAGLQWAANSYTVVFAALLLSAGALADRLGAHRVFRTGAALFAVGSALCALAPTVGALIGMRALLGAAAAACVPSSLALIGRLYPDRSQHARAVAAWAAISGAAVATGPLAGGALVGAAGWRAVFLINVPLGAAVLALTATRSLHCPRGDRQLDWPAQLAACACLALVTDGLIAAGAAAWPHTAAALGGAAVTGAAFARLERRSTAPVLNRALLGAGAARAGLAAGAAVNFALAGSLFVLPLLLTDRGMSALETGLAFLPLTVPFAVNPPLTGRIVARRGPRPPVLGGLVLLAAGGAVLAVATWARAPYGWLAAGLLLTGLGVSFALPALVTAVAGAAPPGAGGSVGGILNAARQTGASLGIAAMGAPLAAGTGSAPWAFAVAAVVCAGAAAWFGGVQRR
ncbi:MFS transporter [Streptomyces qinglanensis]|uniref:MFS transporter, DHA2 family, methylenomycin A resistance protein n=1 Tax=Streptomyces qinglanensis TaxID=943816 RepID=A0A1H9WG92_9ACTN|nr:MFS transporter [Streptomyces qinglanensis]SES32910.1 MFS transporter, DHA2 family, methylenomycin A resistance protein [Streptomyces qinglanensis]